MYCNLLLIVSFVAASAWIDWEHLKDNDYIEDHTSRVVLRTLFCIGAGQDWLVMLAMAMFFASTFDFALNAMMGKPMFYLGTVAKWDKFWNKWKVAYVVFITCCLLASIFLMIFV